MSVYSKYAAQGALAINFEFQQRVSAVVQEEVSRWEEPPTVPVGMIVNTIMPSVATAPGFDVTYTWGDQAASVEPGQLAITDGMLLAAVQPLLEQFKVVVVPQ